MKVFKEIDLNISGANAALRGFMQNLLSGKPASQKHVPNEVAAKLQCLTVKEAMVLLRVSKPTIYQIMNSGELPYITLYDGGDRRIVAEDISAYLEKRRRKQ